MATGKIRQDQIEQPVPKEALERYLALTKALSSAGFMWNYDQRGWLREDDGAGFTEESVISLCTEWPVLVGYAIKLIKAGKPGLNVTIDERPDGTVSVVMTPISLLERLAHASE